MSSLLAKYPWMEGTIEEAEQGTSGGSKADSAAAAKVLRYEDEVTEETMEAIWGELGKARDAMAKDLEHLPIVDFVVVVLGGNFTKKKKGKAFDAVSAHARKGSLAEEFSQQYFGREMVRFEVPFYNLHHAQCLASTYALKVQHYFDIYLSAGMGKYRFADADHTGFDEPEDFQELFEILQGFQLRRAQWLRDMRPR